MHGLELSCPILLVEDCRYVQRAVAKRLNEVQVGSCVAHDNIVITETAFQPRRPFIRVDSFKLQRERRRFYFGFWRFVTNRAKRHQRKRAFDALGRRESSLWTIL